MQARRGLKGGDAEIYADAFADAKAIGLGAAAARDYANALVYLNAIASFNDWPVAEERIAGFIAAFDAAVKVNGASGREALSHAYAAQRGDEASAAAFAAAFAQTDASGVAAHVYANEYVPPHYAPEGEAVVMDELADSLAGVLARGYATSSAAFRSVLTTPASTMTGTPRRFLERRMSKATRMNRGCAPWPTS